MHRILRLLGLAACVGFAVGLASCGEEKCQVHGENCTSAYKQANGITYGCCAGMQCTPGIISGVLICQ